MTGFTSPDVPAYACYLLIALIGILVAVRTINAVLATSEDRWAFVATWGLFLAYVALPILLFWFLDYTGAIHDTALFAAIVVAFGYQQILAGGVQGITMPGQTAALWKPFEAWVNQVSQRISTRNQLYKNRVAEKVKGVTAREPDVLAGFQAVVFATTDDVPALTARVNAARNTNNADVNTRREVDVLWADLRRNRPDLYGWILYRNRIVGPVRYWIWLDKGRAKLMSAGVIVLVVVAVVVLLLWLLGGPATGDRRHDPWLRYYTWRFLKPDTTGRDRWRSREFLTRELSGWGTDPVPSPADAVTQFDRANAELVAARRSAQSVPNGSAERERADTAVAAAAHRVDGAQQLERRANAASVVLPRLLQELRYQDISNSMATDILSLLVECHSPALNAAYVPELIESLRDENAIVRLETRKALVALNADYAHVKIRDDIGKWEPKTSDTPADIDQRVREWRAWWADTQAPPPPSSRRRGGR